jgi:stage II sporulation protein D
MKEPTISVGILHDDPITFELYGTYRCPEIERDFSGVFTVSRKNDSIRIVQQGKTVCESNEILFEPLDYGVDSIIIRDVVIGVKFHWERKEHQQFRGSLKIVKEGEKLTAVNILPIEQYLLSVISSEMSATSNENLLDAHAIISRSWLLAQIEKSREISKEGKKYQALHQTDDELIRWYDREDHTLYDVCADDHCQRYQGVTKAHTEVVAKSIEKTRGIVLKYNDRICDTRYSKSCGGLTESFENAWEPVKHPYLSSVVDYKDDVPAYKKDFSDERNAEAWIRENPPAFCNTNDASILSQVLLDYDQETSDFFRWKVEYTQKEIAALIGQKTELDFGDILDLIPVERGHSARLVKLKIVGSKKTLIIGKDLEIRRALSPSHLYSSAIVVDKFDIVNEVPQKFVLTGAGWGHGVGLCQIGAAVMGAQGYTYEQILKHYFRGAEILKIY